MAFIAKDIPLPRGAYGEITSTLYWCEEKFRWSKWIAEPANSFSNFFFVLLSIYGAVQARKQNLLSRIVWCQLGITLVGIGSFLFHSTLKYEAQLLDELPMIYVSMLITYAVTETTPRGIKPRYELLWPFFLASVTVFITVAYVVGKNPVFHQVAYAMIQLASTARVVHLLTSSNSPLAKTKAGQEARRKARTLYAIGAVTFLTGFAIWNLDNIYCAQIRQIRNQLRAQGLGLLAPWVNGHMWWHYLTGLGAYQLVVSSTLIVMSLKESPESFKLETSGLPFHLGLVVPTVVRTREWKGRKHQRKSQ